MTDRAPPDPDTLSQGTDIERARYHLELQKSLSEKGFSWGKTLAISVPLVVAAVSLLATAFSTSLAAVNSRNMTHIEVCAAYGLAVAAEEQQDLVSDLAALRSILEIQGSYEQKYDKICEYRTAGLFRSESGLGLADSNIVNLFRKSGGYVPSISENKNLTELQLNNYNFNSGIIEEINAGNPVTSQNLSFAPLYATWNGDVNPYPDCKYSDSRVKASGISEREQSSKICNRSSNEPWPKPENVVIEETRKKIQSCVEKAIEQTGSCRAYDKSGFHSRPSASCTMRLVPPENMAFVSNQIRVIEEVYRNLAGAAAQDAVTLSDNGEISSTIRCTNSSGTGRTCEARATIAAFIFPKICTDVKELKSLTFDQILSVKNDESSNRK